MGKAIHPMVDLTAKIFLATLVKANLTSASAFFAGFMMLLCDEDENLIEEAADQMEIWVQKCQCNKKLPEVVEEKEKNG